MTSRYAVPLSTQTVPVGRRIAGRVLAVVALLALVVAGQPVPAATGVLTLLLVAAVVATSLRRPVLVAAPERPSGTAARALGTLVPLSRQCAPAAAGRPLPRAPGGRGPALI